MILFSIIYNLLLYIITSLYKSEEIPIVDKNNVIMNTWKQLVIRNIVMTTFEITGKNDKADRLFLMCSYKSYIDMHEPVQSLSFIHL